VYLVVHLYIAPVSHTPQITFNMAYRSPTCVLYIGLTCFTSNLSAIIRRETITPRPYPLAEASDDDVGLYYLWISSFILSCTITNTDERFATFTDFEEKIRYQGADSSSGWFDHLYNRSIFLESPYSIHLLVISHYIH
jgi:hypothetical protein